MVLSLCPNCRLPVNTSSNQCSFCTARIATSSAMRSISAALAIAVIAAAAMLARRKV